MEPSRYKGGADLTPKRERNEVTLLLLPLLLTPIADRLLSLLPAPSSLHITNYLVCGVVYAQDASGLSSSNSAMTCLVSNWTGYTASWDGLTNNITNYVFSWTVGTNATSTNVINTGTNTSVLFWVVPPTYNFIYLQSSTNLTTWTDMASEPYIRLTNGLVPGAQMFFRSRVETSTNWR